MARHHQHCGGAAIEGDAEKQLDIGESLLETIQSPNGAGVTNGQRSVGFKTIRLIIHVYEKPGTGAQLKLKDDSNNLYLFNFSSKDCARHHFDQRTAPR